MPPATEREAGLVSGVPQGLQAGQPGQGAPGGAKPQGSAGPEELDFLVF